MSFSEFKTHPKRSRRLFNMTQTTQILYPQRKKKSQTDRTLQKQRKKLILTNSNNIFT